MYKTIVEHYWIPTWTLNRLLLGYVKILFWIATFDNSPSWLIQIVIKVNHCLQSSTFLRVFPSAGCWERTRLTEMYCRLKGLKCCGVVICAEEELNGFMCTTRKDCQDADGSFEFGFVSTCGFNFLSPSVFPSTMLRCEQHLSRLRSTQCRMLHYLGNRNE